MKRIVRAISQALHRDREPENLHKSQEPEIVEFRTDDPQLEYLHNGQQPEMVEFAIQHKPQLDETAAKQAIPATTVVQKSDATPERIPARDEAKWLEERPKIVEAIKSGVAALREASAQMRANRATRNAAKTDASPS
jgi:hypothetical protein